MQIREDIIGFGIAGNFARHLEQAGESADFVAIMTDDADAPKGIFPTYVPGSDTFLGVWPFSDTAIRMPQNGDPIQMEPEVALLCEIDYDDTHRITAIRPTHFGACNDCSIRIEGAPKISLKKNWGPETKGIVRNLIPLDRFAPGSMLDHYSLVSFVTRKGTLHQYGEESPLLTYSYFYDKLTDWITDKLNTQTDHGPLEDLAAHLKTAGYPKQMLISIGATRYTEFGESHYLQKGDTLWVLIYDHDKYSYDRLVSWIKSDTLPDEGISLLRQHVIL